MKPTFDQKEITNVVVQIIRRIHDSSDIDDPSFYSMLEEELDSLDGIISLSEKVQLQEYLQEIYLLIKTHKE